MIAYRGRVNDKPRTIRREVRRDPNFMAFLVTGAVVGLVAGALVAVVGPSSPMYGGTQAFGYLAVVFAGLGALAGGLVFAVLDRRAERTYQRQVQRQAARDALDAPDTPEPLDAPDAHDARDLDGRDSD